MKPLFEAILCFSVLFSSLSAYSSELKIEKTCLSAGETVSEVSKLRKGSILKCKVEVKNVCPFFLRDVRVKVSVPLKTEYLSGSDSPAVLKSKGKTYLIWTIPHLAQAEKEVLYYELKVVR